jgi:hypothetical protein
MENELTKTAPKKTEGWTARSDSHVGPCRQTSLSQTPTPRDRARESDHQGAQFQRLSFGRCWPTTVVALRTGGALHSKWTRKTRPWNARLQTTVVASIPIEDLAQKRIEFMSATSIEDTDTNDVLWPHGQRRWQGNPREIPADQLSERTAASTAPPSSVRAGRRGPGRFPCQSLRVYESRSTTLRIARVT